MHEQASPPNKQGMRPDSWCSHILDSSSVWHNQVHQYLAIAVLAAAAVPGASICLSCLHCVCCSRGMSPDDVDHFPYCVAEIKLQVQDVPPWLLGVVQSGGASCRHLTCQQSGSMVLCT